MSMDISQVSQQAPIRVASPQLVAANHILALSSAELQALIHKEAEENPALEMEEVAVCQQCGRPLQGGYCPTCAASQKEDAPKPLDTDDYGDGTLWQKRATASDDEEFDPTRGSPHR